MNSEFNINNKLLGKVMMDNTEKCGVLVKDQYGSCTNLNAVKVALNKRLAYNLMRQRRIAGAVCSNNAKSCYDRIAQNVASLAMRRLGAQDSRGSMH